jgi:hypothetical protein
MHVQRAVGGASHEALEVLGLAPVARSVDDPDVPELAGRMQARPDRCGACFA